jgi:hypothetical protein
MAIDGFNELFNVVYIAKKLFDMGKYELVTESFYDLLDYDMYYENMYSLIGNLFEHGYCRYYENHGFELHILSDKVIVDFFILAGKYGKRNNIPDEDNPYIKEAEQETCDNLNFNHCLDWRLMGHTEPKRPFHSRLGLFISYDCGCLDLSYLVYRLIEIYEWFADKCAELNDILRDDPNQLRLDEVAMAA